MGRYPNRYRSISSVRVRESGRRESGPCVVAARTSPAPIGTGGTGVAGPVVLVVDDSPTIRKIVEIALKRQGIEVISASSGVIALAAIANTPPQLILLDIMLPKVNGYQICQIIRRNPAYRH